MPVVSADVPEEMKEAIESLQREKESRSAVVRRVLRSGLEEDGIKPAQDRRPVQLLSVAVGALYIVLYSTGSRAALTPLFGVYMLFVGTWSVWPTWQRWIEQL